LERNWKKWKEKGKLERIDEEEKKKEIEEERMEE